MKNVISTINTIVMGKKPYNTIFSSNYLNINHIVRFLRTTKKYLPESKLGFVDIGGGAAPYYDIFKELIDQYIVVDVENVLAPNDNRSVRFIKGFAESLPLEDSVFDVVLSNQVLEHVINPEQTVFESFRVLKKGGYFIGSVPHISPIHLEPYDFRRFTEFGLRKILQDAGFINITINANGGVFRSAAIMTLIDITLSRREEGKPQQFLSKKHFILFPLIGLINVSAILLDFIFGDRKRTPSNYCWIAQKPM